MDLVLRLRQYGDDLAAQDNPPPCHEAAAEIERLLAAISWMADQDPQLVEAAKNKFKLKD